MKQGKTRSVPVIITGQPMFDWKKRLTGLANCLRLTVHIQCNLTSEFKIYIFLFHFFHVGTEETTAAPSEETTAAPPGKSSNALLAKNFGRF